MPRTDKKTKITLDPTTHAFMLAQLAYRDMDDLRFQLRKYTKAQKGEPTVDTIRDTRAAMAAMQYAVTKALENYSRSLELLDLGVG